jgi:hypothetical protein
MLSANAPLKLNARHTSQILHLKHHGQGGLQFDAFGIRQTERLVVIQYSVHVFYPESVHRSVKQDPFAIWTGVVTSFTDQLGYLRMCQPSQHHHQQYQHNTNKI